MNDDIGARRYKRGGIEIMDTMEEGLGWRGLETTGMDKVDSR